MKFLLDTNVCIDVMRGRNDVVGRLSAVSPEDCAISAVSLFELESGALKSQRPIAELAKVRSFAEVVGVLPWDVSAARKASKLRVALEGGGLKIGAYDTLLAGHALALGLTLVSDNVREFSRVENLAIENWRDPA